MLRLGAVAALIGALVSIPAHVASAEPLAAEPVITASGCQTYNWVTASCRSDRPAQFVAAQAGDLPMTGACQAYNWLTARCRSEQPAHFAAKQDMETIIAKGCQANNWLTASCHGGELVQVAAAQDIESLVVRGCNVNNWLTVACSDGPVRLASATASDCRGYNWLTAACAIHAPARFAAVQNGSIITGSLCQGYNWLTAGCRIERSASITASRRALTTASIGGDAMTKPRKKGKWSSVNAHRAVGGHIRNLSHARARRQDPDVATLVRISMMARAY